MKARAPGKIVVSGAYAVLEGAPAVVTAVDRYVVADTARPADFEAPEVRAAVPEGPLPAFDASGLREDDRKLGLGSSAAILVASLAAIRLAADPSLGGDALVDALLEPALDAHRRAQGGGSGIDVATAVYGGTIVATPAQSGLRVERVRLPVGLEVEVWAAGNPASTADMVRRVRAFGRAARRRYDELIGRLAGAAERGANAVREGRADGFLAALAEQASGFDALGKAARVPIVTDEVRRLDARARDEAGVFVPAGAGGGDVALFVAERPSSASLRALALELGHHELDVSLEAPGVGPVDG